MDATLSPEQAEKPHPIYCDCLRCSLAPRMLKTATELAKGNPALASNIYTSTLSRFAKFDPKKRSLESWMYETATFRKRDELRQRADPAQLDESYDVHGAIELSPVHAAAEWLQELFLQLRRSRLTYHHDNRPGRPSVLTATQALTLKGYLAHARCSLFYLWQLLAEPEIQAAIKLLKQPSWGAMVNAKLAKRNICGVRKSKNFLCCRISQN